MATNNTICMASSARQRSAIQMAFRWPPHIESCLASFVIFQGSGPVLLRRPIYS